MEMKSEMRGERRRRIVGRESDRMAIITGQLSNLPPLPSQPPPFLNHQRIHSHTGISPSFFSGDLKNPDADPISQFHENSESKDEKRRSISLKRLTREKVGDEEENSESKDDKKPRRLKRLTREKVEEEDKISIETELKDEEQNINTSTEEENTELQILQNSPLTIKEPETKTQAIASKPFTLKRVNSCILASQTTRAFASLIIAFLVIISYIDFPVLGRRNMLISESLVASNPIFILLITDVTIVVGKLLLEKEREECEEMEEERENPKEDGQNWNSAMKVLERGLVVYQAFRAIFIDFSVYAVAVICGLSLV